MTHSALRQKVAPEQEITGSLQEVVQKAIASIAFLAPFSGEISTALVAILAGALGLLTVYVVNGLRNEFSMRRKLSADSQRRHTVDLLQIKRTYLLLEHATDRISNDVIYISDTIGGAGREIKELHSKSEESIESYSSSIERLHSLTLSFNK